MTLKKNTFVIFLSVIFTIIQNAINTLKKNSFYISHSKKYNKIIHYTISKSLYFYIKNLYHKKSISIKKYINSSSYCYIYRSLIFTRTNNKDLYI
ncbi:hypothetical protein CRU93_11020 [Arcobacter sp. CECT 8985]|nr:hypothetical protein CRU93_11020 [Arcobacter sp. CECT 8985]